ncbi:hypothetical protein BEP19_16555 [Ammoniphilus oxalaticus]|uniref:Restriction endonuclease type II-like domain-containing protein n=1 Tax=Ammoniphilus oxalaticus TaxID=66863 RepID=A0A419SQY6_9BACL|nr:DUF559 domain-containing protein [Ammoniphilus oxalaticus]RKD26807.1 hypothetical protein BEP19_16555 [Ammoniphilus oxalaticus]
MILSYVFIIVVVLWTICWFPWARQKKEPQHHDCRRSSQRYLFQVLSDEGYHPTVSYQVDRFELDLAFPRRKLAIDCARRPWEEHDLDRARNRKREKALSEQGWWIIRFTPDKIYGNTRGCIATIEQYLIAEKRI